MSLIMKRSMRVIQPIARSYYCSHSAAATANSSPQINYEDYLNKLAKRRRPSMLREITNIASKAPPDVITFAVGVPNSDTFPFEKIEVELKDGTLMKLQGKELSTSLQYLPTRGYAPLISWLMKLQEHLHGPQDWTKRSIILTAGGQEGLCNTIEMCLEEGAPVIIQRPVYPAVNDLVRQFASHKISVDQDQGGLMVDHLKSTLEQLEKEERPMPKLIYINPTAANPSGMCLADERKPEIYALASKYNIIILEDDSYYNLSFKDKRPSSFLSMDTEGRVIRFDSFSKILSSGLRLGFVTGPEKLLRNIELHLQVSTLHASALSQVILFKLLDSWGLQRTLTHFESVKKFYKVKRDQMIAAVQKHLTGLVDWHVPSGGMFLWLRVRGIRNTYDLALKKCIDNGLIIIPGHPFMSLEPHDDCPYIRLSYSIPSPEQMDEGCARLARIIRNELQKEVGKNL